jgi:outer membrane protein OmpA-like peptidoglycan-associated protein
MKGDLNLITGLRDSRNTTSLNVELALTPPVIIPEYGELLATVYFDFDRSNISREAAATLDGLLSDPGVEMIGAVSVIGYADEFGTERYNKNLSERRAETVAKYLMQGNFAPRLFVEGRGRLVLDPKTNPEVKPMTNGNLETHGWVSMADRIRMVSKARRVDIFVKVATPTAN